MNRVFVVILIACCFSCDYFQPKHKPEAIARVGDIFLYKEDVTFLKNTINENIDSAELVENYIDDWVRKQSLLQNAIDNLTLEQNLEINRKVSNYKESLVAHLYENQIVQQQLDTVINQTEIDRYYNENIKDFVLKEPILQYISVKNDKPFARDEISEVNKMFEEFIETKNDARIAEFCSFEAISCSINIEQYVPIREFYETFSALASNNNSISLKANILMKYQAGNYYYLYRIIDKKNNGYYPLSYVKPQIKELILRKREREFLEELRANVYKEAKINNQVEIYD